MWIESKFGLTDSETRGEVSVPSTEAAQEFCELLLTEVTSNAVSPLTEVSFCTDAKYSC